MSTAAVPAAVVITPEAFLAHWQGHRRLTRRVIEAFPDDQLFSFSVGGMRPFGGLVMEMISMAAPMVRGVVTDDWNALANRDPVPRAEVLRLWDESTKEIDALWSQIPIVSFQQSMKAFGLFVGIVHDLLLYVVDIEVHHRGQGYVFVRALGIEPPPFYVRQ